MPGELLKVFNAVLLVNSERCTETRKEPDNDLGQ